MNKTIYLNNGRRQKHGKLFTMNIMTGGLFHWIEAVDVMTSNIKFIDRIFINLGMIRNLFKPLDKMQE